MNREGFTLIELLAVIVVLAVVALIAVPIILSVIDKAEKGALKDSAYGIIESGQLYYAKNLKQGLKTTEFKCSNNKCEEIECVDDTCDIKENGEVISYKGSVDDGRMKLYSDGKISVCIENGKYAAAKLANEKEVVVNEGTCNYTDNYSINGGETNNSSGGLSGGSQTPSVASGATYIAPTEGETHKGIVYLDPTDLKTECNAENSVSTTGTKAGCMKWYIFDDNGDSYDMILDHNTTAQVAWNSSGTNARMVEILQQITTDTYEWEFGLNPRIISAYKIADITENTAFNGSGSPGSTYFYFGSNNTKSYSSQTAEQKARQRSFAWLFDYTYNCTSSGCNTADSGTQGYWTSTPASVNSYDAWIVNCSGLLYYNRVGNAGDYGVRPVITVSKSIFN